MVVILFFLLNFISYSFAGEPVAIVAQKNVHIKNVRESLINNTPEHNKRCWIALGLTTGIFVASATFAAVALTMYENTEPEQGFSNLQLQKLRSDDCNACIAACAPYVHQLNLCTCHRHCFP